MSHDEFLILYVAFGILNCLGFFMYRSFIESDERCSPMFYTLMFFTSALLTIAVLILSLVEATRERLGRN